MKLRKLYEAIIKFGLQNDPRTKKEIVDSLNRTKKAYRKLKGPEKKYFDKEKLRHPYADTRILYGDLDKDVRTIFIGIDMKTPELLLADRLRERGLSIDLVMSHHPEGRALSSITDVMQIHKDVLSKAGIKQEIVRSLLDERIGEVSRSLSGVNHTRSIETARLLDIPYMCVHTPADNHVAHYLQSLFNKKKPKKVRNVLHLLRAIPEYTIGVKRSAGPTLIAGKGDNNASKILVDMTGGTEGPKTVYARLSQAGIGTVVGMHFSETHYKNAKAEHINMIVAGHISSDTLGLNLLLDKLEKRGRFNIIACSGFERIRRK